MYRRYRSYIRRQLEAGAQNDWILNVIRRDGAIYYIASLGTFEACAQGIMPLGYLTALPSGHPLHLHHLYPRIPGKRMPPIASMAPNLTSLRQVIVRDLLNGYVGRIAVRMPEILTSFSYCRLQNILHPLIANHLLLDLRRSPSPDIQTAVSTLLFTSAIDIDSGNISDEKCD